MGGIMLKDMEKTARSDRGWIELGNDFMDSILTTDMNIWCGLIGFYRYVEYCSL
jgi:hypothetical protein